jgi:putative SOS response-associated peptidase YedK
MCGRFTLTASGDELAEAFDLDEAPSLAPRYNIAPSQDVVAVVAGPEGRRRLDVLRWGFVPERATIARPIINARAESAGNRPLFAAAFARRRCLLPADGFYEWQVVPGAPRKLPHHIHLSGGGLFALAAIWEPTPEGRGTCAILTTEPTVALRKVHDRMPVVIPVKSYATWLDAAQSRAALLPLLGPFVDQPLEAVAVGTAVNNARADSPDCLLPSP